MQAASPVDGPIVGLLLASSGCARLHPVVTAVMHAQYRDKAAKVAGARTTSTAVLWESIDSGLWIDAIYRTAFGNTWPQGWASW